MKTKVLLALFSGILLLFVACEHSCHECHYEDANDQEVELGEKCDDELKELEANGFEVDSITFEVHCHEH